MSNETPAPLPVGFRDVDATAPEKILRCLDCIPALEAGRAYKARALELLAWEISAGYKEVKFMDSAEKVVKV